MEGAACNTDRSHILHSFHYTLHLSCNRSAKFFVLNVYFAEDNHEEKEDKTK